MAADRPPLSPAQDRWSVSGTAAWTRAEDGAAVVVDMRVGRPLALSPSGTAVWEALVGGLEPEEDLAGAPGPRSAEALAAEVATAYGLTGADVADDVAAFLARLAEHGVAARS